eukprot:gene9354-11084_t
MDPRRLQDEEQCMDCEDGERGEFIWKENWVTLVRDTFTDELRRIFQALEGSDGAGVDVQDLYNALDLASKDLLSPHKPERGCVIDFDTFTEIMAKQSGEGWGKKKRATGAAMSMASIAGSIKTRSMVEDLLQASEQREQLFNVDTLSSAAAPASAEIGPGHEHTIGRALPVRKGISPLVVPDPATQAAALTTSVPVASAVPRRVLHSVSSDMKEPNRRQTMPEASVANWTNIMRNEESEEDYFSPTAGLISPFARCNIKLPALGERASTSAESAVNFRAGAAHKAPFSAPSDSNSQVATQKIMRDCA